MVGYLNFNLNLKETIKTNRLYISNSALSIVRNNHEITSVVSASSATEVIAVVDKDAKVVDSVNALSVKICSVVVSVIGTVMVCDTA